MECIKCGTEIEIKTIEFSYDGLDFEVMSRFICPDCRKEEVITEFEDVREGLISKKGGDIQINWSSFGLTMNRRNKNKVAKQFRILSALGILTMEKENNWMIDSMSASLNPRAPKIPGLWYFTRKSDVIAYAREKWSDTIYDWWIIQKGNASTTEIEKKEVIEEN